MRDETPEPTMDAQNRERDPGRCMKYTGMCTMSVKHIPVLGCRCGCSLLMLVHWQVGEDLLLLLLPYIVAGVGKGVSDDYRMASTMIACQLATRAPLSDQLLSGAAPCDPIHSQSTTSSC